MSNIQIKKGLERRWERVEGQWRVEERDICNIVHNKDNFLKI